MKNLVCILFLFCFIQSTISQTINYAINDTTCCSNTEGESFIDIDQDGLEDIRIAGTILTDVGYYFVEALSDSIKVTSITDKGNAFEDFGEDGDIAIGGIACIWQSLFVTGDPNKFVGIQKIEGADTIWSYIEIEFSEEDPNDNSCWDSRVIVFQSVINLTPNQELMAGEILTTTENVEIENQFKIFPNPTSDFIYFQSDFTFGDFYIFNFNGKEMRRGKFESTGLDISDLESGVYFLKIKIGQDVFYKKIIKTGF